MIIAIIRLLIVLGIMVLVHEFGHFAVAKLCGIRVETFSIGFGKRLFGFRRGDTDYRLSLLPLGGYVKMAGDNPGEAPTGDPGEFNAHPRWQRVLVALAGPVANFILALFIMTVVYMNHHETDAYLSGAARNDYTLVNTPAAKTGIHPGDTIVHYDNAENPDWETIVTQSLLNVGRTVPFSYTHDGQRFDTTILVAGTKDDAVNGDIPALLGHIGLAPRYQDAPVKVDRVTPDTPAAAAGLQPGDLIAGIDGISIHSVPALLAYLQDQNGKPSVLSLVRNGHTLQQPITPQKMPGGDGTTGYRLGFSYLRPPVKVDKLAFPAAVSEAWAYNLKNALLIKSVLKGLFQRRVSPAALSGPIGIGQQVDSAAKQGYWTLMELMAVISINLGIFNLLPIPILDGGMITFLAVESVIRRDINQQIKERVYQVAFVCLLIFAAMVIFNDISKLPGHLKL
ncbi:regulator of sigma E protease [Granulicella rosea]|uniref:Zinc metalloprotease n=1 Tax=Granulicella rosea TaxID=474952 RepID=A0A239DZW2_9BACT|nr:RIP metalloprotease RseP [Granulicella rosea]SNS38015.1 regulator of sigma E protease [Granulicella rosea]